MEIDLGGITVRALKDPEEIEMAQDYIELGHMLGNCKPQYRRIYQVAEYKGEWVAVLLWDQCVICNAARDRYIGWTTEARKIHCPQVVNNKRFCIGKGYKGIENIGSKILGLSVRNLPESWKKKYKEEILMCETYVDPKFYDGTSYKAAGWEDIGESSGYETRNKKTGKYEKTSPKRVFLKELNSRAKEILCLPYRVKSKVSKPQQVKGKLETDFSQLDLAGLRKKLENLPDQRRKQGQRYKISSLIMGIVFASLSGCNGYTAIHQWLAHLGADCLHSLGMKRIPSEPTIRRMMQYIDLQAFESIVYGWLMEHTQYLLNQDTLSMDGKVLRGTKNSDGEMIQLMSAVIAPIGITVAQMEIKNENCEKTEDEKKTNEIPVAQKMLENLSDGYLKGKIVVADAIHTQTKTADIIIKKKAIFNSVQRVIRELS